MKYSCDICEQEWDESFFCKKCSSRLVLEETLTPKLIYYGDGDEYEPDEDWVQYDVCCNCCTCSSLTG